MGDGGAAGGYYPRQVDIPVVEAVPVAEGTPVLSTVPAYHVRDYAYERPPPVAPGHHHLLSAPPASFSLPPQPQQPQQQQQPPAAATAGAAFAQRMRCPQKVWWLLLVAVVCAVAGAVVGVRSKARSMAAADPNSPFLNRIMTSSNGRDWTLRASPGNYSVDQVIWGGGVFLASAWRLDFGGMVEDVLRSTDGVHWSLHKAPMSDLFSFIYGKDEFLAVGTGDIATSRDGNKWTLHKDALGYKDSYFENMAYGAPKGGPASGLFVGVSSDENLGTQRVRTSEDGITWVVRTAAADNYWKDVVWGGGQFVAVTDSSEAARIMTSENGIDWVARTSPPGPGGISVCYGTPGGGPGLFVAVAGDGGHVITSGNGVDWMLRPTPSAKYWSRCCWGDGMFVAVATDGSVMTSGNGVDWILQTAATPGLSWHDITYGNGMYVAVGSSGGWGI